MYRLGTVYIDTKGDVVYVPDRVRPPFTADTPLELKAMLVNAVLKVVREREGVRIVVLAPDFKKRRTTTNGTRKRVASRKRTDTRGTGRRARVQQRPRSRRTVSGR